MVAETLSVEERVERQIVSIVETIEGVTKVERWDEHGNSEQDGTGIVLMGEAAVTDEEQAPSEYTITQEFMVGVMVKRGASTGESGSAVKNRIAARIKKAIMADYEAGITEGGTGERLAYMQYRRTPPIVRVSRERMFRVRVVFAAIYQEYADDPYNGSGLTERTV